MRVIFEKTFLNKFISCYSIISKKQPLRDDDMTTSTSLSTNNDIVFSNVNNANNPNGYPPHSIPNNNNGTPGHIIDRHHAGLSSMTISGGSGNGFVHLTDGCRTLTLPRRSNPSAAAQSKILCPASSYKQMRSKYKYYINFHRALFVNNLHFSCCESAWR